MPCQLPRRTPIDTKASLHHPHTPAPVPRPPPVCQLPRRISYPLADHLTIPQPRKPYALTTLALDCLPSHACPTHTPMACRPPCPTNPPYSYCPASTHVLNLRLHAPSLPHPFPAHPLASAVAPTTCTSPIRNSDAVLALASTPCCCHASLHATFWL